MASAMPGSKISIGRCVIGVRQQPDTVAVQRPPPLIDPDPSASTGVLCPAPGLSPPGLSWRTLARVMSVSLFFLMVSVSPVPCRAGLLSPVTPPTFGDSQGRSGYPGREGVVSPVVLENGLPVVLFLSERGDIVDDETDWDLFASISGVIEPVSIADQDLFDVGQAYDLTAAGGVLVEIRYTTGFPPDEQKIFLREPGSVDQPVEFASGSAHFEHPRLSEDLTRIVFSADDNADVQDVNSLEDVFVQFVYQGSPLGSPGRITDRTEVPPGDVVQGGCAWPDVAASGGDVLVVYHSRDNRLVTGDSNDAARDVFLWRQSDQTTVRINRRTADPELYAADYSTYGPQTLFDCGQPAISGDTNSVVFVSSDPFIVPDDSNSKADIFLYDIVVEETRRVSTDWLGGEGDGDCFEPDLDTAGRFAVFLSDRTNFASARFPDGLELNGSRQVYLCDTASGYLECVSVNAEGIPADNDCFGPAISPDGRYVTFSTSAETLAGLGNMDTQVFLCDRGDDYLNLPLTATSLHVSCQKNVFGDDGYSCEIDLSAEEPAGDPNPTPPADFIYRFLELPLAEEGTLLDRDGFALPVDPDSGLPTFGDTELPILFEPVLDFQGSVSFRYQASDSIVWSRPKTVSVTVADFDQGLLSLVSAVSGFHDPGNDSSGLGPTDLGIAISGDGNWVAFASDATNLTDEASSGLFLRSTSDSSTCQLLSSWTPWMIYPAISLDGTAVVYVESWNRIVWKEMGPAGPTGITRTTGWIDGSGAIASLSLSANGDKVVFSTARPLLAEDTDEATDIYLWEPDSAREAEFTLLSQESGPGIQTDSHCYDPFISADGRVVAFFTKADFDGAEFPEYRIWLKYLDTGSLSCVDLPVDSDNPQPALSWTGRYLAFETGVSIRVEDLADSSSALNLADCENSSISADGRYVYFSSKRGDLVFPAPGDSEISHAYRYDLSEGTVAILSRNGEIDGDGDSTSGLLSEDGRRVVFVSKAENLLSEGNGWQDVFLMDLGQVDNTAPVAQDVDPPSIDEDTVTQISLNGTDVNGNDLRYRIATGTLHGDLSDIHMPELGEGMPTISYTPDQDWYGTDSFMYECRDSEGWSPSGTVDITVSEVNDLPEWTGIPSNFALDEDDDLQSIDLGALVIDPDVDNPDEPDVLAFSFVPGSDPPGWATVNGHLIEFFPGYDVAVNADPAPVFDILVQVTDSRSSEVPLSSSFAVTVNNVDRPPVITSVVLGPEPARTADDLAATVTGSDPDEGDMVTYTYQWQKDGGPQAGQTGATVAAEHTAKGDAWNVAVRAHSAGLQSAESVSQQDLIVQNTPPAISPVATQQVDEDAQKLITVTVNDDDAGETLEIAIVNQPDNGFVSTVFGRSSSGQFDFSFLPDHDYFSPGGTPESFSVRATDSEDYSEYALISVLVNSVNDPPVLGVNGDVRLASAELLAQDSVTLASDASALLELTDVDNDAGTEVTVSAVVLPARGTLTDSSGAPVILNSGLFPGQFPLTYEADPGQVDTDSIMFRASDLLDDSEDAEVTVYLGFMAAELQFDVGWNMISLPMSPDEPDPDLLFVPEGRADPCFLGNVWAWNAQNRVYQEVNTLEPKRGYWVFVLDCPDPISVTGPVVDMYSVTLHPGWNLVGPVGFGLNAELPLDARGGEFPEGSIMQWDGGDYVIPTEISAGKGYWIRSSEINDQQIEFSLEGRRTSD